MKSILPLPQTNCVLLLYVVPTVTKHVFLLLLIWNPCESEEDWALTDVLSNFYHVWRGSWSMLLMVLSGNDTPEVKTKKQKNKHNKTQLNECRAFLVVSLKVVCYKLKTHWTQCFHQEFGVPDVSENLLEGLERFHLKLHMHTKSYKGFRELMHFHIQNTVDGTSWSLSETRRVSLI